MPYAKISTSLSALSNVFLQHARREDMVQKFAILAALDRSYMC